IAHSGLLPNRPLAYISFALNYYLHRYNVVGYRLINILIHLVSGILLYLVVKNTMVLPVVTSRYGHFMWIPYVAACVWLIHPLHSQSVTYIVQRMTSMAAMFYMLSMWLYIKARQSDRTIFQMVLFAGCGISGILALGTKETSATLPVFIFLYEWFFFQDLSPGWLKRRIILIVGVGVLFCSVVFLYTDGQPLAKIMATYKTRDFTLLQRVLSESRVVILYLGLIFYPHPDLLNLDYDFPLSYSIIDPPTTLLAFAIIIGMLTLAFWLAPKDRLVSYCLFWFLGNLVIESTVVGLELVFEHRTYLPSMLIVVMTILLVNRYLRPNLLKVVAVISLIMVLSVWTYERNSVWNSDVTLWQDVVKKSPQKARPHNNLGNALRRQGKLSEAIYHFKEALRIDPNYAKAHNNLGIVLATQGDAETALSHFYLALELNPSYAEAYSNIGVTLARQGRLDEAINNFSIALRLKPDYAKVHNNLGAALVRQGRLKDALEHFKAALLIKPDDLEIHNNLNLCLRLIKKNQYQTTR
ncbi:MAG: tetratricopeptide repeat protein, partial [Desulfobacterales bacterium]